MLLSVRVSDVYTKAAGSLFGLAKFWTQWLDAHQPQAIQEGALTECEASLAGSLRPLLPSHKPVLTMILPLMKMAELVKEEIYIYFLNIFLKTIYETNTGPDIILHKMFRCSVKLKGRTKNIKMKNEKLCDHLDP